jgi:hypothetical protein
MPALCADPDMSSDEGERGEDAREGAVGGGSSSKGKASKVAAVGGSGRPQRASACKALEYFGTLPE